MMERKKVDKSKLSPSFSLGLTQSDDSKSSRSPRHLRGKMEEVKQDEKKQRNKRLHQQKDERDSDDNEIVKGKRVKTFTEADQRVRKVPEANQKGDLRVKIGTEADQRVKKVPEADQNVKKVVESEHRLRHKMSIPKVYEIMQSIKKKSFQKDIIEELNKFGFGGILHICNWTRIHTFFVDWIVNNFDKDNMCIKLSGTKVLQLEVEDVHRVYHLPMLGKRINTNVCSDAAIKKLRKELGLADIPSPFVKVAELEKVLNTTDEATVWVKGAICFIIHNLLCPTNHSDVSLQYAQILEDAATSSSYNWCSHILNYMKEGLQNPGVANPLADFHFLLINYLDKMGKKSPFLTGQYKHPSLRDWDVRIANQDIQKVYEVMGLEHGLTAGVTQANATAEAPIVLCFDPDTCPISKVNMYLDYSKKHVQVYTSAIETLERRVSEANVGGGKTVRFKSSVKRINVQHGGLKDDVESDDVKEQTVKQFPQYFEVGKASNAFDAGEASNAEFNKSEKNIGTDEQAEDGQSDNIEEQTVKQFPQYFVRRGKSKEKPTEVQPETNESQAGERFNNDYDVANQTDDEDEIDPKIIDDSVRAACNVGATMNPSQEIILSNPQSSDVGEASNSEFNKNDSDPVKTPNSDGPMKEDNFALHVTPLALVFVQDVETSKTKKKKKSNQTQPEGRRAVKKSKYFQSPYDEAVLVSTASKLQKDIATYAWSGSHDMDEIMYNSDTKSHNFVLQRTHLISLQQDRWVSSFVLNSWVNCLNWDQAIDKMTRLVTPLVNYTVLKGTDNKVTSVAFDDFVKRLSFFKYINYTAIDPTALQYIMTPALNGDPGNHYVCFVVNIKSRKFEFLNSLNGVGQKLQTDNKQPTVYKKMFDMWLNEVKAFVEALYKDKNIKMPFNFSQFTWDTPTVPSQPDKDSCGIFCMKFLSEWDGHIDTMKSFKGWYKKPRKGKFETIMDFRIQICSSILTNSSNSRKAYVEKEANSNYEETLRKLQDES